jgi:alpha-glucosidase
MAADPKTDLLLSATPAPAWWQRGVIYQIYPRSFMDANGDGIGDLEGITQKLDYLAWLGVDAIWISPFYPSPMADFGYDVSDYCDVDPQFGTLARFDALLAEAHRLGLRVILDYIPNHSSDRHPWFQASKSSRSDPKRDWYVWRDPGKHGGPPSNWLSEFGGPAWTFDETTGQYYYHAFLSSQPDLNWRNPEVRRAMADVLRFWLERGVDGFRVDAIHHLFEAESLHDNPPNPRYRKSMAPHLRHARKYTIDLPEVIEAVRELRAVLAEYDDRVLIGEAYLPFDRLMRYYGAELDAFHLPFNFHLIGAAWEAKVLRTLTAKYEALLPRGAWPNWVLGNHDRPRIASRVGLAQARVAAVLLLTLRGTPTLYYGDELGMRDVPIPPEAVHDPYEKNVPGMGFGRDPERTPMQWSATPNAGFSSATPWLPLASDHAVNNVETARHDPRSMLSLVRALLALRRARPALALGSYQALKVGPNVLAYVRSLGHSSDVVLLNLSHRPQPLSLPPAVARAELLLSTHAERRGAIGTRLLADEAVVLKLSD